ncbi:hypothetical protein HY642_02000 [Candidatus Woesearchaeota archaeon]|nr:hypothetical protein [Candidatus Woesearchaeota archaeon]
MSELEKSVRLLELTKAQELQLARSAQSSVVAVVTGQHDHIHQILDAAKIPYTQYERVHLALKDEPKALFLNCTSSYQHTEAGESMREFVEKGGRIITTDWSLYALLRAFPGYVKKGSKDIPDSTYSIAPANDLGARLYGAEAVKHKPKWWFESSSYTVFPEEGKRIMPLLVSEQLKNEYGTDLVAFGIRHGKGEWVHFTSHLYAQRTGKGNEGVATHYTALHAVLMLCGKAPVLWDPSNPDMNDGKSVMTLTKLGVKSQKLL